MKKKEKEVKKQMKWKKRRWGKIEVGKYRREYYRSKKKR